MLLANEHITQTERGTYRVILIDIRKPPGLGPGTDPHPTEFFARGVYRPSVSSGKGWIWNV